MSRISDLNGANGRCGRGLQERALARWEESEAERARAAAAVLGAFKRDELPALIRRAVEEEVAMLSPSVSIFESVHID
jgi:hypothetical protein